jgi:hypothetical protein
MQIQTLTFEQLIGAVAITLVLIGAYNTIMGAIKTHREEEKRKNAPVNTLEETVRKHDERLQRDHKRLNDLEEANRIQMRAQMAILHHEIDGNSTDGLKQSYDEIQKYLIEK